MLPDGMMVKNLCMGGAGADMDGVVLFVYALQFLDAFEANHSGWAHEAGAHFYQKVRASGIEGGVGGVFESAPEFGKGTR
jgi:hypothetical protein